MKADKEMDMLPLVKEKIQEKIQIETTCLIEAKRLKIIIKHKYRLIHDKVFSNAHTYRILK